LNCLFHGQKNPSFDSLVERKERTNEAQMYTKKAGEGEKETEGQGLSVSTGEKTRKKWVGEK